MGNKITGKEYPLSKIFSSDFEYHIPSYQRPYAWTESETGILFDDLFEFYQNEKIDNYFLGSVVLIKDENNRYADVIDGQQRLTTLSILFSVMADSFQTDDYKNNCKKYLQDEGNILEGIVAQPRLFLRERDQAFFCKYIQNLKLNELLAIDSETLKTESQKHIQKNCEILKNRFIDAFANETELLEFSKFLLTRCFLVTVSTPNQDSAFRVFSVMNSRGLDLLPTDIIKSLTIGKLDEASKNDYTEKWEELENRTGREGFNEVFTHTRTIFAKERPKKNLLDEFKEFVVSKIDPKALIDDYLVPYTNAYIQLKNCEFSSTNYADEINNLLYWLNKTNNYDWMPPAIKFLAEHKNDSAYILWFIKKLERLASYLLVTGRDVNQRADRYKWVLVEMDSRPNNSFEKPLLNVELTTWEKEQFLSTLNDEIYTMTAQRRNYIIQRLDSFVSDGGAFYNTKIFTIEHILPQHPAVNSQWMSLWPDVREQGYWLNRIANLVPLSRQRNSAAQNYDFATKKAKYFQTKGGTTSYTLTTQVLNVEQWTPNVVKSRQKKLLDIFSNNWNLSNNVKPPVNDSMYNVAGRGANALGYLNGAESFIVHKGSRISDEVTDSNFSYKVLRDNLIASGIIKDNVFTQDYEFAAPSAASAVVLGRASNGRKEWTKIDGRNLAQIGR